MNKRKTKKLKETLYICRPFSNMLKEYLTISKSVICQALTLSKTNPGFYVSEVEVF